MVSPQAKREAVTVLMTERDFGVTRACGLLQISRALYRYQSRRAPCAALRERISEIAALKRRYGYRRIHVLLRREGWRVNRKLTYRLYREAGLAVRRRKRKRIGPFERKPLPKPTAPNRPPVNVGEEGFDFLVLRGTRRTQFCEAIKQDRVQWRCRIATSGKSRHPDAIPQQYMIQQLVNAAERPLALQSIFNRVQLATLLVKPLIRDAVVTSQHSERV